MTNNEKMLFIRNNIKNYEKSDFIKNEFKKLGIHVDINKQSTINAVQKYSNIYYIEDSNHKRVPMTLGKNFEKTFHIYTDGRINCTVTSMNDMSNAKLFNVRSNFLIIYSL